MKWYFLTLIIAIFALSFSSYTLGYTAQNNTVTLIFDLNISGYTAQNNTVTQIFDLSGLNTFGALINSTDNTTFQGWCSQTLNTNISYIYNWYKDTGIINKTCYQESANTTNQTGIDTGNCGLTYTGNYRFIPNNLYINYTKPNNALSSSLWMVKHGYSNLLKIENISIPSDCWSQTTLQLEIYSRGVAGSLGNSTPYCYNGSTWNIIGTSIDNATSYGGTLGDGSKMIDGNWSSFVFGNGGSGTGDWRDGDPAAGNGAPVYEEAMYWSLANNGTTSYTTSNSFNVNNITNSFLNIGNNITLGCTSYNGSVYGTQVNSTSYFYNGTSSTASCTGLVDCVITCGTNITSTTGTIDMTQHNITFTGTGSTYLKTNINNTRMIISTCGVYTNGYNITIK